MTVGVLGRVTCSVVPHARQRCGLAAAPDGDRRSRCRERRPLVPRPHARDSWCSGSTAISRSSRWCSLRSIVATVVIDGFAPIRWIDAVVPFGSAYRPIWLGFGALALDLLVAIAITSLVRARLGYGVWRAVHWTTYGTWVVAILHGAGVGSDTRTGVDDGVGRAVGRCGSGGRRLAGRQRVDAMGARPCAARDRRDPRPPGTGRVDAHRPVAGRLDPPRGHAARPAGHRRLPLPQHHPYAALVLPEQADFAGSANIDRSKASEAATLSTSAQTTDPAPLSLDILLDGEQEPGGFSVHSGTVRLIPPRGGGHLPRRGHVTGRGHPPGAAVRRVRRRDRHRRPDVDLGVGTGAGRAADRRRGEQRGEYVTTSGTPDPNGSCREVEPASRSTVSPRACGNIEPPSHRHRWLGASHSPS